MPEIQQQDQHAKQEAFIAKVQARRAAQPTPLQERQTREARLEASVPAIVNGGLPLRRRERQIAAMVAEGMTQTEIAAELFISCQTVKTHLKSAFDRAGVRNKAHLAAAVVDARWLARMGEQLVLPLGDDMERLVA